MDEHGGGIHDERGAEEQEHELGPGEDGEGAEGGSQPEGAGVAHQEPGGGEVEDEKPEGGAGERPTERPHSAAGVDKAERGESCEGDGDGAGGEPVDTVGEVDGVGGGDEHEGGKRHVERAEMNGIGNERHEHFAPAAELPQQEAEERGRAELEEELRALAQTSASGLAQVVHEADEGVGPGEREHPERFRLGQASPGEGDEERRRGGGQHDGEPAPKRAARLWEEAMDLLFAGLALARVKPEETPPEGPREDDAEDEGDQECGQ